ncbi:hypothetical protein KUV50_06105 [Membranicola marinus]|uniref:SGNH hydrolase-type esterase domain-containing protein n=1 Tax=Membranihabitans marinus TaxID=1227546 RepID=A0A953HTP5_9BACT|nr:GDSL-type esterase/lipase family protein [Membranihabitans marinus]MBY5957693.1 hypothetical protein [Membranihabitans marinus]
MIFGNLSTWSICVFFLITASSGLHGQSKDQSRRDALQSTIDQFSKDRKDGKHGEPDVIFVGSSSFRGYKGFEEDYKGINAINLGFGGSLLSDVLYFFDELIEPYDPKQIIVYEGDNDLNAGMSAEEFMADVRAFVRLVNIRKPGAHISFLTPKPSPARRKITPKYEAANQALYEYAKNTEGVDFIDVSQPMYRLDGTIRPEIWTSDSLHMNRKGYEIWGPIIRSYIRE